MRREALDALSELRDKPADAIRITTGAHAAETIRFAPLIAVNLRRRRRAPTWRPANVALVGLATTIGITSLYKGVRPSSKCRIVARGLSWADAIRWTTLRGNGSRR